MSKATLPFEALDICDDAELEDDSLQHLAYTLFCAYCGPHTTPSIKAYIQEQLQVSAT